MSEEEKIGEVKDADQTAAPAAVPATRPGMSIRLKVLLGLLVVTVIGYAALKAHGMILARSLAPFADERLAEISKGAVPGEEYAADVSADREFGLYGELLGKVAVYIKTTGAKGEEYAEVDYIYGRDDKGAWQFRESGGCSDSQCRVSAIKAFAKKGAAK